MRKTSHEFDGGVCVVCGETFDWWFATQAQ